MSYDPAVRRKTPLALAIAERIGRDGPICVEDYVSACLWDQQHGYYATRRPLGQAGDFVTAPEISQIFGELIGLWSAVVWRDRMVAAAPFTLAEFGPGRGTMMCDMLRATARVPGFQSAMNCQLLEGSPTLRAVQRATLAAGAVQPTWIADVSTIGAPAIIIANEFFDALPVRQWVKSERGWGRRSIELDDDGNLQFGAQPVTRLQDVLGRQLPDAPLGSIIESQRPDQILDDIGARAQRGRLAMLIIDYGHETTAVGDTLQAVRQHRHEHPLTSPGEADLSAQVDFQAIADAAHRAGLAVDGPITQAEFLGRLGIIERARNLMAANPARSAAIEIGVARLMAPDSMGTRFKVLGLRSPDLTTLPGFEAQARKAERT